MSPNVDAVHFFLLCFPSPHHFALFLPLFFFSSPLLIFFSPMSASPFNNGLNYDFNDNVDNESEYHLPSAVQPPPTPPVSMPSRLPIETIAWLTHDKLCHNPEFMKPLSLVDALLLNAWLTPSSEFRYISHAYAYLFIK